jgi:hypothetical protein
LRRQTFPQKEGRYLLWMENKVLRRKNNCEEVDWVAEHFPFTKEGVSDYFL